MNSGHENFHENSIGTPLLASACLIGVVTTIIANSLVTNQIIFEAQERVKEDLNTARYVYTSKIQDIDQAIRWTVIRHVLKAALKQKNVSPIQTELEGLMAEEGKSRVYFLFRSQSDISSSLSLSSFSGSSSRPFFFNPFLRPEIRSHMMMTTIPMAKKLCVPIFDRKSEKCPGVSIIF